LDDRDLKPKRRNKFRSSGLLQATRESWEIRLGPQNTGPNEIGNQAGSAAACPHEALPQSSSGGSSPRRLVGPPSFLGGVFRSAAVELLRYCSTCVTIVISI
jgi:hypothetical protein